MKRGNLTKGGKEEGKAIAGWHFWAKERQKREGRKENGTAKEGAGEQKKRF